jgi:hypothetical protein
MTPRILLQKKKVATIIDGSSLKTIKKHTGFKTPFYGLSCTAESQYTQEMVKNLLKNFGFAHIYKNGIKPYSITVYLLPDICSEP